MTRNEAWEVVNANRLLFPMDFLKFTETDFNNMAMLYAKALGEYTFKDVREAFIECTKQSQHCIKIADMYAKLTRSRGRDAMMMRSLKETNDEGND